MMSLPVFYAFARSGGTLLNRCLGCISGNLVLSEINPHASVIPIEQQAKNWLHLLTDQQVADLKQKSYGDKISYLATLAHEQGYHLIIRDWVTANFLSNVVPGELNLTPSLVLEQNYYLSRYGLESRPIVITRRAADVYESIIRTFEYLKDLSVEEFGYRYLCYAKVMIDYPIFHYETLCQEPEAIVSKICSVLAIQYDASFMQNFSQFTDCTGDNSQPRPSRGSQLKTIAPLRSNSASPAYIAASQDENCQKADMLLNYAH